MRIRHLVALEHLDAAGFVRDPLQARHGIIVGGRIAELAGPIEPLTHLNLDFADHRLDDCLVAEQLEPGAALVWDGDQFRVARPYPQAYTRLGPVDLDRRRLAWQELARRLPGGAEHRSREQR